MPAQTARRSASPAQIRFLTALVAERNGGQIPADLGVEIETALAGGPIARDLIDRVLAVPRSSNSARPAVGNLTPAGGEEMAQPSTSTRAGRMLLAGGIETTVTLPNGEHVTVRVKTSKRSGRGWARCAPTDEGARTNIEILGQRVGWINVAADGTWTLTLRTRREVYVNAITATFEAAAGEPTAPYRVQVADRCGRCHLPLTDPVSIDRGIGPDCFGRDTGSQHVARERESAQAVEDRMHAAVEAGDRAERLRVADAESAEIRAEAAMEAAAFEPAPVRRSLTELAANVGAPRSTDRDVARARDLIAEALDANCNAADMAFAMRIFDQLAGR